MPGSKGCTAPVKILFGCYFWFVQWPGEVGGHRLDVWLLSSESVKNSWFFPSRPRPCETRSCLLPNWATRRRDTDEKEANVLFIHSCTQIKCLNPQQISEADDPLEFQAFCILIMYNFVIFVGKVKTKKDPKKVWRVFIETRSAVGCLIAFTSGHKHTKMQLEGLLKAFLFLPGPTGWFKPTS